MVLAELDCTSRDDLCIYTISCGVRVWMRLTQCLLIVPCIATMQNGMTLVLIPLVLRGMGRHHWRYNLGSGF